MARIAQQVKSGEIDLPSLDLESDAGYDCVWALVDSGAGRPCATRANHFPNAIGNNEPPRTRMATATGKEIESDGVFKVEALSPEGKVITQEFEDTDVDMQILSVTCLSANGEKGSHVHFRDDGGDVVDVHTHPKSAFVKKRGAYLIELYVKNT